MDFQGARLKILGRTEVQKPGSLGFLIGFLQPRDAKGVIHFVSGEILETPRGCHANWVMCWRGFAGVGWDAGLGVLRTKISGCSQAVPCFGWQMLQNATGVTGIDAFQLQLWP